MHVDDDGVGGNTQRAGFQLTVDGGERIVHRRHVHEAQRVHHQDALAGRSLEQVGATARRVGQGRIVERADQARLTHDIGQRFLLVPRMVAQRQAIGAGVEQLACRILRQAEARRGVFRIDNDELESQASLEIRQMFAQAVAARPPHHVPKKSKAHKVLFQAHQAGFGENTVKPFIMPFARHFGKLLRRKSDPVGGQRLPGA